MKSDENKKLTIAIFIDDFYPNSGGVARSVQNQVNELVLSGHKVVLFAPKLFFEPPTNIAYEAMDTLHIPGTPSFACSLKFSKRRAKTLLQKYNLDIVHSQTERGAMFLAAQVSKQGKIPHIHTFHANIPGNHRTNPFLSMINSLTTMQLAPLILGNIRTDKNSLKTILPKPSPERESSFLARLDWRSMARIAGLTDAFTSPAGFILNAINESTKGETASQSHTIVNGISTEFINAKRSRPLDDSMIFLASGRLDPEKRFDVIIEAFIKLNQPNAQLHILGEGNQAQALKLKASKIKNGKIKFLGYESKTDKLAQIYANADCFVLGSYRFDSQAMVLAEAAAAGCPIIYCDDRLKVGTSKQNAILTGPSADEMSAGMLELYDNRDKLQLMADAGKKIAKNLDTQFMADQYIKIYLDSSNSSNAIIDR